MKKLLSLFLIITLISMFLTVFISGSEATNRENGNTSAEDGDKKDIKVKCNATIKDDFTNNIILVVINNSSSEINKTYSEKDFPGIDIDEIKDLTQVENKEDSYECLDKEKFQQILSIKLAKPGKQNVLEAIKTLENNPIVESAEPDCNFALQDDVSIYKEAADEKSVESALSALSKKSMSESNSILPDFDLTVNKLASGSNSLNLLNNETVNQYGLTKINAYDAWDLTTGSSNVKVGIIDSGICNHLDLISNMSTGYDFYNNNATTSDDISGHGTLVAGVIGAVGNNSYGVCGVSWAVSLVPLQVSLTDGLTFNTQAIISAINYASTNDIEILNMSFVYQGSTNVYETAMSNYNGLMVCAAGNSGTNNDTTPRYPANSTLDNVISVAATDSNDDLTSVSNYGVSSVDLAAPGDGIISTYTGGSFAYASGTSLAAPFVAGTAALLSAYNNNLTSYEIRHAILISVDKISGLSGYVATGGRLNAYAALSEVLQGSRVKNIKVNVNINSLSSIGYGYAEINYERGKSQYYSYENGTALPSGCYGSIIDMPEEITYTYYNYSNPIISTGTFTGIKFNSRMKNENIQSSFSQGSTFFRNSAGNVTYPGISITVLLMGDVNSDNNITASDATLVLQHSTGNITLSYNNQLSADVNQSGTVTASDALLILQYSNSTVCSFW